MSIGPKDPRIHSSYFHKIRGEMMTSGTDIKHLTLTAALLLVASISNAPAFAGATPVTECGTVLSEPGNYKLTGDLSGCTGAPGVFDAITIAATDISLNLDGYTISCSRLNGLPNTGILVFPGLSDVTIENGEISNCDIGILTFGTIQTGMPGPDNFVVRDMRIINNQPDPVIGGGQGLVLDTATNSRIVDNYIEGNSFGIFSLDTSNTRIANNVVTGSTNSGIDFQGLFSGSNENSFLCNQSTNNGRAGIAFVGTASENSVRGNIVNDNLGGIGLISLFGSPIPENNLITNNSVFGNTIGDLVEAILSVPAFNFTVVEPCRNNWRENNFGTQVGPQMCIGGPVQPDDDICDVDDDD